MSRLECINQTGGRKETITYKKLTEKMGLHQS